jgi:hypothetical protein
LKPARGKKRAAPARRVKKTTVRGKALSRKKGGAARKGGSKKR